MGSKFYGAIHAIDDDQHLTFCREARVFEDAPRHHRKTTKKWCRCVKYFGGAISHMLFVLKYFDVLIYIDSKVM